MSDDSNSPPGAGAPDDVSFDPAAALRLAIVSRTEEAVAALWDVIDRRSRKRNRPLRRRANRTDADVIVYLAVAEDFASESAAESFAAEVGRDTAQTKIVLEFESVTTPRAHEQIAHLRDRLGADGRAIEWIVAPISTQSASALEPPALGGGGLRAQAKQIEKFLKGKESSAETAAMFPVDEPRKDRRTRKGQKKARSPERGRERAARREARAGGVGQPRPKRSDNAATATKEEALPKATGELPPAISVALEGRAQPPADMAVTSPGKKRGDSPTDADRPSPLPAISVALGGMREDEKAALLESLRSAFRESGAHAVLAKPQSKAHIAIHAFGDDPFEDESIGLRARSLMESRADLRIFLGRISGKDAEKSGADDRAIAQISHLCRGAFVDRDAQLRRYQTESSPRQSDSRTTEFDLTAALIVREATNRKIPSLSLLRKQLAPAPDLIDAHALANRATELLSSLSWSVPSPPKLLRASYSEAGVELFANSRIELSAEVVRDFAGQIDWQMPLEGPAARRLFGLGFLIAPLSYWYSKASENKGELVASIDAMLKQQGVTASAMLERVGEIILDFGEKVPLQTGSLAWLEGPVSTRIRASLIYLLCCKLAAKRRIKFDEARCGIIFRSLVDHIEFLRSELPYPAASIAGVERDCLLVGAGLALQRTGYGNVLLRDSLERLRKLQLDIGLSADGVWQGAPFATHCAILSLLTTLLGDLANAGSDAIDPLAGAVRRMTLFVDASLKSNGEPLPIDGAKTKSYAPALSDARAMLARLGARSGKDKLAKGVATSRITETYIFRDARYFVSHSTPKVTPDSSQVALHAEKGSFAQKDPGGLKLAFAYGPTDLLLGAVPPRKELSGLKPSSFDSALRNGYRVVTGSSAGVAGPSGADSASIVKSWRGSGWAAAKGIDSSEGLAGIARTVVHLKTRHALLVVDELATSTGEIATFEQFWHVAPGMAPAESPEVPLLFTADDGTHLGVAYDDQHESVISTDRDPFSSCIRRRMRVAGGVVATLFQRTGATIPLGVSLLRDSPDDWIVAISGEGLAARVSLNSNELRVDEEQPPQAAL